MLNIIWNYGFTTLCIELQLNSCKVVNKPRITGICYRNIEKSEWIVYNYTNQMKLIKGKGLFGLIFDHTHIAFSFIRLYVRMVVRRINSLSLNQEGWFKFILRHVYVSFIELWSVNYSLSSSYHKYNFKRKYIACITCNDTNHYISPLFQD